MRAKDHAKAWRLVAKQMEYDYRQYSIYGSHASAKIFGALVKFSEAASSSYELIAKEQEEQDGPAG